MWACSGAIPTREIARVMTCLTVTPTTAAEAIGEKAGLIVSHHPVLVPRGQKYPRRPAGDRSSLETGPRRDRDRQPSYGVRQHPPRDQRHPLPATRPRRRHTAYERSGRPRGRPGHSRLSCSRPSLIVRRSCRRRSRPGQDKSALMNNARSRFLGRGPFSAQRRPIRLWASVAVARRSANCVLNSSVQRRNWRQCLPRSAHTTPMNSQQSTSLPCTIPKSKTILSSEWPASDELIEPRRLAELAQFVGQALGRVAVAMVGHPQRTVQRVAVACGAGDEFLKDAARGGRRRPPDRRGAVPPRA